MVSATVSPEVAAHAAKPPKVAVLASATCVVVAPSNALSPSRVTVEGTVAELSLHPDCTTVGPPEVAASTADPLEVSVVTTYKLLFCPVTLWRPSMNTRPVTAMEAICEYSSCPDTAMVAICKSLSFPVTAMEAVCESSSCSVTATEATFEHLPCSEPVKEAIYELLPRSEPAMLADCKLSVHLVSTNVSNSALSVLPVSVKESKPEKFVLSL